VRENRDQGIELNGSVKKRIVAVLMNTATIRFFTLPLKKIL